MPRPPWSTGSPEDRKEAFRSCKAGFLIANYEQLLRDLEVMRLWKPDLVVLDQAQRIKNWATKTAAYVKRLDPPYRLVLTGTPMQNRIDELASILDWVDSFALEPKWRLVPWHATYVAGGSEIGGARNLRHPALEDRPLHGAEEPRGGPAAASFEDGHQGAGGDDPEQLEEHDALKRPIMQLMETSKKRPLTQAEFLRLMSLLTAQNRQARSTRRMDRYRSTAAADAEHWPGPDLTPAAPPVMYPLHR